MFSEDRAALNTLGNCSVSALDSSLTPALFHDSLHLLSASDIIFGTKIALL